MTSVYIVQHTSHSYPDGGDVEFKDLMMSDRGAIKGVFSSKRKAEDFVYTEVRDERIGWMGNGKGWKEFEEEHRQEYTIEKCDVQ